ncbi:MAG TPA: hypothetical protein VK689_09420 [Armatimonadota bacterium]|nr:hypothetical protein [Armatimonadota bacterium]
MRKLQPGRAFGQGFGCSVLWLLFGLSVIAVGLLPWEYPWSPLWGRILLVAFGALWVWSVVGNLRMLARFGRSEAQIDRDVLRPGDTFELRYRRPVRRATRLRYLGVFLVFREEVRYDSAGEAKTGTMDRLVLQIKEPERTVEAGDAIEFRYRLAIPERPMGIRNPFMDRKDARLERRWVVKVRLHLAHGQDIWDEYPLEVAPLEGETDPMDTGRALYDLVLEGFKFSLRLANELGEIFPHLEAGQIGDLLHAKETVVFERLPEPEAEALKRRLEAAGASATLQPAVGAATAA